MIPKQLKFECLTPCFCAGADQARAEIRPTAVRGALRWWFRTLGGSPEDETEVFGGTQPVRASAIQIRISDLTQKSTGQLPTVGKGKGQLNPVSPLAYILYFASIAGGKGANFGEGPRWQEQGSIGPGSSFILHLRQLRKLSQDQEALLHDAIETFKHYGSIGLRATRGLGAVQAEGTSGETQKKIDTLLRERGFAIRHWNRQFNDWVGVMAEAGKVLKNELRSK